VTQREYETRTAPINTTTASNGRIDINIVKEDAEWLSRTARLNLVAALRVVIVEIQSRPAQHLTTPLSSQDAANLQEAAGLNNGQGNSFLSELGAANAADADEIWTDLEKPDQRKRRIFDTYLTERRYFMMTADLAHSIQIYGRLPIYAPVAGNLAQLYRMTMTGQTNDEVDALLSAYIRIVGDRMGRLDTGVKDMTDDNLLQSEDTEISLAHTLLVEVIHAMSVVFQLADNLEDRFPPSTVVSSWFSIMDQYAFLSNVQPVRYFSHTAGLPTQTGTNAPPVSSHHC
jgi:nuclear pore complex protein Nup188